MEWQIFLNLLKGAVLETAPAFFQLLITLGEDSSIHKPSMKGEFRFGKGRIINCANWVFNGIVDKGASQYLSNKPVSLNMLASRL